MSLFRANRHGGPDDQEDLHALLAAGDHYEQEATPPDTDVALRDLHLRADAPVTTGLEPQPTPADDHDASTADPARTSAPDAASAIKPEAREPTVLIVDDEEAFSYAFAYSLKRGGFNVVGTAANGREAIEIVGRERPDLVTMDLMMPVMDGNAATRIITRDHPGTRVVAVTARSGLDDLYRALESGAVGFLTKPFSTDEMHATLREVMRGGLPIAAAIMAAISRKEPGHASNPPTTFFTRTESAVLRHLADNAPIHAIAASTGLTVPEVTEIQSLIARKIQLRNDIEGYSKPQSG